MKYERDFLTLAICELQFDPVLRLENEEPVELQESCKHLFPRTSTRDNIEIKGTLSTDAGLSTEVSKQFREWILHNDDIGSSLSLNTALLRYQQQQYTGEERFFEEFGFIWDAFQANYAVPTLTRVGLRYVNQIRPGAGDRFDWDGLIRQSFVDAAIGVAGDDGLHLSKSAHELRFTHPDHRLTVRFGLLNEDYPGQIAERGFLLDYDCYSVDLIEAAELLDNLRLFHSVIEDHFEDGIEDGLRTLMGIVDNAR